MDFCCLLQKAFTFYRRRNPMPISDYELDQLRVGRGRKLSGQVTEHRNGYYVRSQSGSAKQYNVKIENGQWKCDCEDFRYRSEPARMRYDFNCKHILATLYALKHSSVHTTKSIERTRAIAAAKQKGRPHRRSFVPH